MAYYKDLTQYQIEPRKLIGEKNFENVFNIGWLGEDGNFTKGEVSEEFLMNLWEYYRYPVYMTRKLYNNEGLDGYWKFFTALYNGRRRQLGKSEIRVMNKQKDRIYAAPELILHYIMNHKYLPPQEFIDAVMTGPKPDSEEFCEMIRETFVNVRKLEC
uniref:DUF7919 family protein n=1 Tax=Acetatifactor sp. TaxID=1872090 RepID=UPI0040560A9C